MIGTNIRSIRHLYKSCNTDHLTPLLIRSADYGYEICLAIQTKMDNSLLIFNHFYGKSIETSKYLTSKELKPFVNEIMRQGLPKVFVISDKSDIISHINEIRLLPTTFFQDYDAFLKNNSKMFNSLIKKYYLVTSDIKQYRLYIYTEGSKNFFSWAVNMCYGNGISMSTIKNIFTWNDLYVQLVKNLSKGTITAYTSREAIDILLTELTTLRKNKRISDAINLFNTAQKKLLRNNELSEIDKETLSKFSKLTEVKQINFIQKMSTVQDFDELMRQMRNTCSIHFAWSKDSFNDYLENVEGIQYKKIFEKDDIILLEVFDYDTVKQLAKTTNWCISKNKRYWNDYVERDKRNTKQYLIFDFSRKEDDKLSIIGFTTKHNKGITHAHDFVNNSLTERSNFEGTLLKSYISRFISNNNIYNILANDGIDISIIANFDKPLYEWNKESAINYLYECVNQENVDILMSDGDKMAVSVKDKNIKYFIGDAYYDNITSDLYNKQHIIFFDFSLSKYDTNRLQFAIINGNGYDEDYCIGIYNEHALSIGNTFESKLIEFGLPYDIIRRTDNIMVKIRDGITCFNVPMIKECFKACGKESFIDAVKNYVGEDEFCDLLSTSIRKYMSFDYLDFIYDNNMSLASIIGISRASSLLRDLTYALIQISRELEIGLALPSAKEINDFYNEQIGDNNIVLYIGHYIAIKKIITSEKFKNKRDYSAFVFGLVHQMHEMSSDAVDSLMCEIAKNIDFSYGDDTVKNWLKHAALYGNESIKSLAETLSSTTFQSKAFYDKYLSQLENKKEAQQAVAINYFGL